MTTYIGYYRAVDGFMEDNTTRARAGDRSPNATMQRLIAELPEKLPSSCRIVTACSPVGGAPVFGTALPGVIIVETDAISDLEYIQFHYAGFLMFQWAAGRLVGQTRAEREAYNAANPAAMSAAR